MSREVSHDLLPVRDQIIEMLGEGLVPFEGLMVWKTWSLLSVIDEYNLRIGKRRSLESTWRVLECYCLVPVVLQVYISNPSVSKDQIRLVVR